LLRKEIATRAATSVLLGMLVSSLQSEPYKQCTAASKTTRDVSTYIAAQGSCREGGGSLLQGPHLILQSLPLRQRLWTALLQDHGCVLLPVTHCLEAGLRRVGIPLHVARGRTQDISVSTLLQTLGLVLSAAPAPPVPPAAGSWMRTAPRCTLSQSWPPACRCSTAHGTWPRSRHVYIDNVADTRSSPFSCTSASGLPRCTIKNARCLPLHTVSKLRCVGVPLHTEACFQHAVSVVSGAQMQLPLHILRSGCSRTALGQQAFEGAPKHACLPKACKSVFEKVKTFKPA